MQSRNHLMLAWGIIGVFFVVDLIWLPFSRLTFARGTSSSLFIATVTLVAVAIAPTAVIYRLRSDCSPLGRFTAEVAGRAKLLVHVAAFTVALAATGVIFSYLSTSLALPLRDAELASIDHAIGFDWIGFLTWTNDRPLFAATIRHAYHTTGPQFIGVYLLLCFSGQRVRLQEFFALVALASLITGVGMTIVPAEGAYAYYNPAPAQFSNYSANSGMWHYAILEALRSEAAPRLDFSTVQGLVTFPSFHTVLAIITCYAVRDFRWIFLVALGLNAFVLIGTITEGGHHLVDLIAGAIIALASIAVVRSLGRLTKPAGGISTEQRLRPIS